jgi:hypothetical protein
MPEKNTPSNCPAEREILQAMIDAGLVKNGYAPRDTPALTVELSRHRRNCPFCNGTALEQLFGQKVIVLSEKELSHAA